MSVSFSEVSTLMFRFPGVSFAQFSFAATTPAETLPSTCAFNWISPRRLNTRTVSPSRIPRAVASAELISRRPNTSRACNPGRFENVEFRKLSAFRARSSSGNALALAV